MTSSQPPTSLLVHGGGSDYWASVIREQCPKVDVVLRPRSNDSLETVTGLIGWRFPPDLFLRLPALRWIQYISVDVVEWANSSRISSDVVVTNTKGLYNDSVADYVMWSLLTLTRKFDTVIRNQAKRRWRQVSGPSLAGKTLGILGMGNIGCSVAQRARAFGLKTIGLTRGKATAAQAEIVDRTVPAADLYQVIENIDALAVCLPLTDATRGLLNADLIRKMRPTSYLVSISRAEITDQRAIRSALRENRLAGAALDVFEKEPLSRWNSIWKEENLIVTPHLAALSNSYRKSVGDLIVQNINRFAAGKTLLNVVEPIRKY